MNIVLGGMALRPEEQPESIPLGGEQALSITEYPGGNVGVQNFGPKFRKVSWSGWFEGTDAYERMEKIEQMRQKGKPIDFQTEKYSFPVVIKSFTPEHRKNTMISFSITLQRMFSREKIQSKDTVDTVAEKKKSETKTSTKPKTDKTYTVEKGDTLSKIALREFGDANKYTQIYEDNKSVLKNGPHKIMPGMKLTIKMR